MIFERKYSLLRYLLTFAVVVAIVTVGDFSHANDLDDGMVKPKIEKSTDDSTTGIEHNLKTKNNKEIILKCVERNSKDYMIPMSLILAVIKIESNFNTSSVSPKGAKGLMQLMPETIKAYQVHNPFDPSQNIRGGVAYLRFLINRYKRLSLSLASYNAGPGSVDHYNGIPPYKETREYVRNVLRCYRKYRVKTNYSDLEEVDYINKYKVLDNHERVIKKNKYQVSIDSAANFEKNGKMTAAAAIYHKMITRYPDKIIPYLKLSSIYEKQGDYLKSINILRKYLYSNKRSKRSKEVKKLIVELTMLYR